MKKFDLKAALNGEPVVLRDGRKAFVLCDVTDYFNITSESGRLIGVKGNIKSNDVFFGTVSWTTSGHYYESHDKHKYDIIGMWEEPKISIEDLPKPFNPKDGDKYFYFSENGVERVTFCETDDSDTGLAENGQCFRTEEDAQKWLDFMKSMME